MGYSHGIIITEQETGLIVPNTVETYPFVVGIAPVETLTGDKPINKIKLVSSLSEFETIFGSIPSNASDPAIYTLSKFAEIYFKLYRSTPLLCVNVFDPAVHKDADENPDPTKVTASDIIGGYDADTETRTGIELVEEVYAKFGIVPGILAAPKFSADSTVANALISKAARIDNNFKAMAYIDAPDTSTLTADIVSFKQGFSSPFGVIFAPAVLYGDEVQWLSAHAAGLTAVTDFKNSNIPYESPSNKTLYISEPVKAYSMTEANYLNSQGIVTVLRIQNGWKLWGNRTSAYPENTDIKDSFIATRRMANYIENSLVLTTIQKVDDPMNKRLISTVVDGINIWLNGFVGRGYLLGAKVTFLDEENPSTDLAAGIIRFHVYYLTPPPAKTIEYIVEVDLSYFSNLT